MKATVSLSVICCCVCTCALSQSPCRNGVEVEGTVADSTGAIVPGAAIRLSGHEPTVSDANGHYAVQCVVGKTIDLTVGADGFAKRELHLATHSGSTNHVDIRLAVATVTSEVDVSGESSDTSGSDDGAGTLTLNSRQLKQLADDPDDMRRQLQVLASAAGGNPSSAIIRIDGFQNSSALPPKSSIASIRVNPDLFSSEYQFPPFGGGQVEITTKPGAASYHGAAFLSDSEGAFNATDPFSLTATPASKRRYGGEFSGPIVPNKSGFELALEKRDINEFNVVNAMTLDSAFTPVAFRQSLAAPQRLWTASARTDLQTSATDVANLSFSASRSSIGNAGAGGLNLAQTGYTNIVSEYDLRFSNMQTISARTLHETRIGYSWKRNEQDPTSTDPNIQVAGYFTTGGSTQQALNYRERDLEIDDDILQSVGKHELKAGAQTLGIFVHDFDPSSFNGSYVFGGGAAPTLDSTNAPTGQTETITPLEQYRRALLNLPGGQPTTYQVIAGNPVVPVTQWRLGLYAQDSYKVSTKVTLTGGLRYDLQTTPDSFASFGPRFGLAWALDQKQTWVFHLRAGLFSNQPTSPLYATQVYGINGVRKQEATVYSPNFQTPLVPTGGSIQVSTVYQFPESSLARQSSVVLYANAEHTFAHQWLARLNFYYGEDYNVVRIRNINAPLTASSIGEEVDPLTALQAPRPYAPNENILVYQNSGHLNGDVASFSLDQHSYKRFGLSARYAHMNFKSNAGDSDASPVMPQSSYSDRGESSRVDWLTADSVTFLGNLNLPGKLEFDGELDAHSGHPYNITTGTDNNGDGDFNDRPAYASSPQATNVYSTRFGLLTPNAVNGTVPRNLGTLPSVLHLDVNLSRDFILNPQNKDHLRTLSFNARSANLLNHTNVTAVNSVLSSAAIGQPLTAEAARRVEVGVRFSF